ncbi:MAG: hypothetical protein QNK33_06415 [Bacteroidales bacterium]|nr:hypothetical protein [Bacteroidales bacterium]
MRNLIVSALIILFVFPSCKFIRKKGWFGTGKADALIVLQARQDSIRKVDSIKAELDIIKAIEQLRIDSLMAAEEALIAIENSFRFHIIVGSFLTPEYATDHLEYYKSMGYDAKIVDGPEARFNLVSAEAHNSVSKAYNRLVAFQDTVEFEAWLYTRN